MVRGAQTVSLLLFFVVLVAVVPAASAQKPRFTEKQRKQFIIRFPKSDANQDGNLDDAELLALRNFLQSRLRNSDFAPAAKDETQPDVDDGRWKTAGFTQANSMGRGAAAIPEVITLFPGQLPKGADGIHYTAEGYITLGKITATAVQDYYRAKR